MSTPARPGINERWSKGWKTALRNSDPWYASYLPQERAQMGYYIDHGKRMPAKEPWIVLERVDPPWRSWEDAYIEGNLNIYKALHEWRWERAAIEDSRFDDEAIAAMFAATELVILMGLRRHALFPRRYPGQALKTMYTHDLAYTALAVVACDSDAALALAELQLEALRRGHYDSFGYPTSAFLARLLASHLGHDDPKLTGDPKYILKGEIAADPHFEALLACWREPDPAAIAAQCLAACDVHTHQAYPGPQSHRREFKGTWMRTPIAVLLVFRLRELRGLANPALEHPLMATIMGTLPRRAEKVQRDPLLAAVRARMEGDGFDAAAIRGQYR